MYWYNKIKNIREMDLPKHTKEKAERLFKAYTKKAAQWKKKIAGDAEVATEYEAWLLA
jgi:hypothetical protein